jgi:cytochrome oxidase Cu insertion factor (SCO1/SenC/PrrC family)
MKKILIGLIAVAALAGLGLWQFGSSAQAAPDVTFTALDGQKTSMHDLRGKVVLVKFWATSCTTCVAQMPDTIAHYRDLRDKGGDAVRPAQLCPELHRNPQAALPGRH